MQQKHITPSVPRAAESAYLATRPAEAEKNRKRVAEVNAAALKPGRPTKARREEKKKASAERAATLELANLLR